MSDEYAKLNDSITEYEAALTEMAVGAHGWVRIPESLADGQKWPTTSRWST